MDPCYEERRDRRQDQRAHICLGEVLSRVLLGRTVHAMRIGEGPEVSGTDSPVRRLVSDLLVEGF
jgi:hypothetical protein